MSEPIEVRPIEPRDRAWAERVLSEAWGSAEIVTRGRLHHALECPALVAEVAGRALGLLTYRQEVNALELLSLNSQAERRGVGSALIARLGALARAAGVQRIWLITSNDNLPALGFYQRRGFQLVAVHRGAIDAARRIKPEIPAIGLCGVPLRDEIELEWRS